MTTTQNAKNEGMVIHRKPPFLNGTSPQKVSTEPDKKRKFQSYSFGQMMTMPAKTWFINEIVGRGDTLLFIALPNVGKTFVAIDLAFALCLNRDWAGIENTSGQRLKVLYCMAEGFSGFAERLRAAALHYGVEAADMDGYLKVVPDVFSAASDADVIDFITEFKERERFIPDVIFFDTLVDVESGLNENYAGDMSKVWEQFRLVSKAFNDAAIVPIHHTGKNGEGTRGSGAHDGKATVTIKLSKDDDGNGIMECKKNREAAYFKDVGFTLCAIKGSKSVFVSWGEVVQKNSLSKEKLTKACVEFLKRTPGKFTKTQIREQILRTLPDGAEIPEARNFSRYLGHPDIKAEKLGKDLLYSYEDTFKDLPADD